MHSAALETVRRRQELPRPVRISCPAAARSALLDVPKRPLRKLRSNKAVTQSNLRTTANWQTADEVVTENAVTLHGPFTPSNPRSLFLRSSRICRAVDRSLVRGQQLVEAQPRKLAAGVRAPTWIRSFASSSSLLPSRLPPGTRRDRNPTRPVASSKIVKQFIGDSIQGRNLGDRSCECHVSATRLLNPRI